MSGEGSSLSDADKIRLKRLARLGTPSNPPNQASQTVDALSERQQPKASPPRLASSSQSRLLAQVPATSSLPPLKVPRKPSPLQDEGPARRPASSKAPHPSSASDPFEGSTPLVNPLTHSSQAPAKPYEEWEDEKVRDVFSVSLQKIVAASSDWQLCWLKDLQGELEEESQAHPRLVTSIDLADRILIARLSIDSLELARSDDPDKLTIAAGLPHDETIFEYLTGCWRRLYAANREIGRTSYSKEDKALWEAAFTKLRDLIISYCGMTLEDPTMFPQPPRPTGPAELLPILLSLTPSSTDSLNADPLTASVAGAPVQSPHHPSPLAPSELIPFLTDLASGTKEVLADVLTPTLSLFFQEWYKLSPTPDILGSEWRRYLGAMVTLVRVKMIAALMPSLNVWVAPGLSAPELEWKSIMGPLTRMSVYPREFPEVWKSYFSNPTDRKVADIDANKSNLRYALAGLHTSLFTIYNSIVRASPEAREGVLDFFALVIRLNEKRSGLRVDTRSVSSDGYMTNLQIILLRLFEPVMDVSFSKIDKIDADYYRLSSRIAVHEETKIRATKEEMEAYYGQDRMELDAKGRLNFISDLFFLLNAFQHLGMTKTIGTRLKAEGNIRDMEKELKHTEASQGDWAGNPALVAQGEAAIKKLKSDIATLHASIHAYDTQLLDPAVTRLNITFTGFLMTWLVRMVDPKHRHPSLPISFPVPAEPPLQFRMLPEYLFDNVAEYYDFVSRYEPDALDDADKDTLITFVIIFLSPGYVNNPFLKAKLVSILANGLYPTGHWRKGSLFDRLGVHSLSTRYLMPTLIRFFIDVEITGGHTQFWDKFNFRRDMSRIVRSLWSNPLYREAFVKSRHDDFDQFIKFVNMLMSDTTFHLEESLTNLSKINSIQAQRSDAVAWSGLPRNERDDLDSQFRQAESQAPFHTSMGLDHVELIRDFTATTKEPFVTAEIVDRLVATLDDNLVNLVGPKMQDLRMTDPDKYLFKPKRLLAGIGQIYLNLAQESEFIRAVANDGRSYTKETFEKFARILKNRAIMTDAEVSEVVSFTQKVEDMKATILIEDEREIPDDFLDPLLSTLMKDPVILPVSRVVIDRSTIRTVLLSKELDPFNNQPLKYEDCIPDIELKAKIDAWIVEGQSKRAEDVMDVDTL